MNATSGIRPCIRIEGVSKRFGDTIAVDNVSLDIGAGAFCAPRTEDLLPRGRVHRASVFAGASLVSVGWRWSVPS